MKEKDDNLFYDISGITETSGIRERATVEYMNAALSKEFSDIKISEVSINESGVFKNKAADFLAGMAEIGVVLLMFGAGLETNMKQLLKTGPKALLVAVIGVAVPLFAIPKKCSAQYAIIMHRASPRIGIRRLCG